MEFLASLGKVYCKRGFNLREAAAEGGQITVDSIQSSCDVYPINSPPNPPHGSTSTKSLYYCLRDNATYGFEWQSETKSKMITRWIEARATLTCEKAYTSANQNQIEVQVPFLNFRTPWGASLSSTTFRIEFPGDKDERRERRELSESGYCTCGPVEGCFGFPIIIIHLL